MHGHSSWSTFGLHLVKGPWTMKTNILVTQTMEVIPWSRPTQNRPLTWDDFMVHSVNRPLPRVCIGLQCISLFSDSSYCVLCSDNISMDYSPDVGCKIKLYYITMLYSQTLHMSSLQSYLFNTTLDNTTTSILWHKCRKPNFLVQIYLYTTTMTMLIQHS